MTITEFKLNHFYRLTWDEGGVVSRVISYSEKNKVYTLDDIMVFNTTSDCMMWEANPCDFDTIQHLGKNKTDFPEYFL